MPKYYFHFVGTADDVTPDEEGTELRDDQVALQFATRIARDLVAEFVAEGEQIDDHRIDVMEGARRVGSVRLRDVVRMGPEQ